MQNMQARVDAIREILAIDEQLAYSEKEYNYTSNDMRKKMAEQQQRWEESYARDLSEIRPFEPSMLQTKEAEVVEEEAINQHVVDMLPADKVIFQATQTANAIEHMAAALALVAAATFALVRLKWGVIRVIALCALAGGAWRWFGVG